MRQPYNQNQEPGEATLSTHYRSLEGLKAFMTARADFRRAQGKPTDYEESQIAALEMALDDLAPRWLGAGRG